MNKIILVIGGIILLGVVFLLGKNFNLGTNQPTSTPKEVVGKYMRATLGTIPEANVNLEKAKEYVTDELKDKLDDPSFIPLSYGIQDGPTDIKLESENIDDDAATVIVSGIYGTTSQIKWQFDLILKGKNWKITKMTPLSQ